MIERLAIADVWTYTPQRFSDARGWFYETYNDQRLAEALGGVKFVQDNQSMSRQVGTLRGMHFKSRRARRISSSASFVDRCLMLRSISASVRPRAAKQCLRCSPQTT